MIVKDIVEELAEMGYRKPQARAVLKDLFRIIEEAMVRGEKVTISGFGTFDTKVYKGHKVQDVHTKEKRVMEDYKAPQFSACRSLRTAIKTGNVNDLSDILISEE